MPSHSLIICKLKNMTKALAKENAQVSLDTNEPSPHHHVIPCTRWRWYMDRKRSHIHLDLVRLLYIGDRSDYTILLHCQRGRNRNECITTKANPDHRTTLHFKTVLELQRKSFLKRQNVILNCDKLVSPYIERHFAILIGWGKPYQWHTLRWHNLYRSKCGKWSGWKQYQMNTFQQRRTRST